MIMPRGQQLLLPANPMFILFTLLMALFANMVVNISLVGNAAWMPDFLALVLVFWCVHQSRVVGIGVAFFLFAKDDPELIARRAKGVKAPSFAEQFAPLANVQVWRFSLYYFFVFGAFVALALWLPHYLIDVYHVDVETAGMSAAAFSLSASLFRAYGGHLSDKFGARSVMYWTFGFALVFLFMLSYPPTDYVIQGKDGPIAFSTSMGLWPFIATLFALGFFMSLGKAAVFKHIPVYYPNNVGAVGGLVGMIGGLGGFVLPIALGEATKTVPYVQDRKSVV